MGEPMDAYGALKSRLGAGELPSQAEIAAAGLGGADLWAAREVAEFAAPLFIRDGREAADAIAGKLGLGAAAVAARLALAAFRDGQLDVVEPDQRQGPRTLKSVQPERPRHSRAER